MANKKLSELNTITELPVNAFIHITDPTDETQSITGSDFKINANTFLSQTFRGAINLSTPTPILDGTYRPTQSGTYTNFGGLVVDLTTGSSEIVVKEGVYSQVITPAVGLAGYVAKTEIVDDLTTDDPTKVLSSKQGKKLQDNKVDLGTGKNLFNKDTITPSAYMGENGVPSASLNYFYSDFIKVEPGESYVSNAPMRFTCYYDENKNFVIGGSGGVSNGFTVPVGVGYVIITPYNDTLATFQLEKGTVSTPYIPFKNKIVPAENLQIFSSQIIKDVESDADTFKLFLPKEICIAVGRTIELYNNQVSWCGNINDYSFVWSGVGKSLKRKWSCTGVTIGSSILTLKVYNKNNILIATKVTTVKVASNIIASPFTICPIGDSLSNSKQWYDEVIALSENKISFKGTRSYGGYGYAHEGRSGADASYYLGNNTYTYEMNGYNGIDGRSQTLNPFWNPATSDVDFNYYKSNYTQNPDKLIIWLGTNGIAVNPTTNANNIKSFINKIRATGGSTIKIFVVHTLFRGNQNGIGVQEGTDGYIVSESYKLNEDLKVFNLQERLLADLGAFPNLYLVPVSTCHDSENNFGQVVTPVNPRATQTELMPSEATHPQLQGYNQIADIIFSSLVVNS